MLLGVLHFPKSKFKTISYAKFGGQTECIMGNSKIVNKRVNRKLKEVSRFSRAKQRQGNVQESVLQVQSCFFAN